MTRLFLPLLFLILPLGAAAQMVDKKPPQMNTFVSSYFFGPNALPVPDMLLRTASRPEFSIAGNYAVGHLAPTPDRTATVEFSVRVPLFTERVNLSIWGQGVEYYWDSREVREMRHYRVEYPMNGCQMGDIYFSTDIKVLQEKKICPSVIVRAACKTASGGRHWIGRFFNTPGYFGDICIVKHFRYAPGRSLRAAASGGFICWQATDDNQDDGIMYGVSLGWEYEGKAEVCMDYGGYLGWVYNGDRPDVLKVKAHFLTGSKLSPFLEYWHGFHDWPFDAFKLGVRFSI